MAKTLWAVVDKPESERIIITTQSPKFGWGSNEDFRPHLSQFQSLNGE